MDFTKEEIKWLEKEKKEFLRLGNMLDELNQRAHSYISMQGRGAKEAQEQALQDFQNLIKPNEFIPSTSQDDFNNLIYFTRR